MPFLFTFLYVSGSFHSFAYIYALDPTSYFLEILIVLLLTIYSYPLAVSFAYEHTQDSPTLFPTPDISYFLPLLSYFSVTVHSSLQISCFDLRPTYHTLVESSLWMS